MGCGASMSADYEANKSKAHVLVVGGGFGGAACCQQLHKHGIDFTLVDPKAFFYHKLASIRAVVQPELTEKLALDYKAAFGDKFTQDTVSAVDLDAMKAKLSGGKEVEFTKAVFATGAVGPFPGDTQQTEVEPLLKEMSEAASELEKADTVAIVGGGPVGTELAGEIRDAYKFKKIVIVHSRKGLASDAMGEKFQEKLKSTCEKLEIELKLGEKVTNLEDVVSNKCKRQTLKLSSGEELEADFIFTCVGNKTRTDLTSATTALDLNERGQVKVDSTDLHVIGQDDAYAIGDCCDYDQEKMAAHAGDHGTLVADNINLALGGREAKIYKPKFAGMFVTMGADHGVGIINGTIVPGFVVNKLKGRTDMFLPDSTKKWMKPLQ